MLFFVYMPVWFIGVLLAYPLVPIAVYFADEDGRLPWIFRWLETYDNPGWSGPQSEPATAKYKNRRVGLWMWLWRNKAYRLRWWMRARVNMRMEMKEKGTQIPPKWGFSYWYGKIGPYFEFQPVLSLGFAHIYFRIGWKLKPFFGKEWPQLSSASMYTGITFRTDDWDDFK